MPHTQRGFTILEITVVLIVIGLLIAILSPAVSGYLAKAREAKARADIHSIDIAITTFQQDLALLPRSNGSSPRDQSLPVLFLGDAENLPRDTVLAEWDILGIQRETHRDRRNLFSNHLLQNDPNHNGVAGDGGDYPMRTYRLFAKVRHWDGPYVADPEITHDPWGNAYMVSFFEFNGATHGKIVSAGPDGVLQTRPFMLPEDPLLISDDFVRYIRKF